MTKSRVLLAGALAAALALASAWPASACIDTFDDTILRAQAQGDSAALSEFVRSLTRAHAEKPTLENGNDLGVTLVLAGKVAEAVKLLEQTDKKFPGSAEVAANLGTALELGGDNEKALEWIREAIKRDATEHEGSEWLHARILEAKIAVAKDAHWFDRNRVLELDFGTGEVPTAPEILPIENGRIKGAEQLVTQIKYQLAERAKYFPAPDPFVGDLFASLGDLEIAGALSPLDQGSRDPTHDYEEAIRYGAPRVQLIRKRLARYKADFAALPPAPEEKIADYPVVSKRFEKPPVKSNTLWPYVGAATAGTVLLVIVGMLIDRRRRKRAEATPSPPLPDVD